MGKDSRRTKDNALYPKECSEYAEGPKGDDVIGKIRVTVGIDRDDQPIYRIDLWKTVKTPSERCNSFTGTQSSLMI